MATRAASIARRHWNPGEGLQAEFAEGERIAALGIAGVALLSASCGIWCGRPREKPWEGTIISDFVISDL